MFELCVFIVIAAAAISAIFAAFGCLLHLIFRRFSKSSKNPEPSSMQSPAKGRIKALLLAAFSLLLLSGCKNMDPQPVDISPPAYVEQSPAKEMRAKNNRGSLFGRGSNPIFSDKKAMNAGDIVTVRINEMTNQSSKASRETNKINNSNHGLGLFAGAEGSSGLGNKIAKNANPLGLSFGSKSASNFEGSGAINRKENFQTTLSARIVKVLANGDYFIAGQKELLISGEKQIIKLSGVIRPYDINQRNEIESALIADAKIIYGTQGDLDRATQKPWGTKLADGVMPF